MLQNTKNAVIIDRVTSGMKNLKNLKKSGNFTSSQEKMTEKPENLKKSGFLP